ncbi:MAG: hypothetical protein OEY23_22010, partial [Acidimicrobiia bacterium]|nr:hypothetical protein [Acidimicrobiia bacterium]
AIEKACGDLGVAFGGDPALVDAAFCEPGARIVALTPEGGGGRRHGGAPRYRWTSHPAASAP